MRLRGGVCFQSGSAAVCLCMRPPRRDECSGTMRDDLAVGVLA